MKYLLAAIAATMFVFSSVFLLGAIWGGTNMIAPCHSGDSNYTEGERIVGGAMFGGMIFALYGGLPSAVVGAFLGPFIVRFLSREQDTRRPPE